MELAVNVVPEDAVPVAVEAERLGYCAAFAPEGFRSDAVSVLGAVASHTTRIGIGTGVLQLHGRTPAMTAMTAGTLDLMSGGRLRLGLGVSNPYIVEGWHGVPFRAPLQTTREYVHILRTALRGDPVEVAGEHFTLPLPGGRGAAYRHQAGPLRGPVPIYLGAVGPRNLELTGAIADGWFGVFCSPATLRAAVARLAAGRASVGRDLADFAVIPSVPTSIGQDPRAAAEPVRRYVARFISLGSGADNFYYRLMCELGHRSAADRVQELQGAGHGAAAAAAVPFDFLDETSMLGPERRVAARLQDYAEAGATVLAVSPFALRTAERVHILQVVRAAHARTRLAA